MSSHRIIVHADMDAFFASVEQRDDPQLQGKPVIVGATSARGVVAAASYEARRFGVFSAMPAFEARKRCPHGVYLPGRHQRYQEVSAQVQEVFRRYTPLVEPLALDEAFLDVSGSVDDWQHAKALAQSIQQDVWQAVQLRVSVGVAPNKLVAKIACGQGKPRGLVVVLPQQVEAFVGPLPIGKLWGVGPVLEERLRGAGIATLRNLSEFSPRALSRLVGRRSAELQALARGCDERPVQIHRVAKSCGEECTFEQDVTSEQRVFEVLAVQADTVAKRLRRAKLRGRTVTIKVRPARALRLPYRGLRRAPHSTLTRSRSLEHAVDEAEPIVRIARSLWSALALDEPVRLLGVSVSGLQPASASGGGEQLDLFAAPAPERPKRQPIGPTLDRIQERFGAHSIQRAVTALPTSIMRRQPPPGEPEE